MRNQPKGFSTRMPRAFCARLSVPWLFGLKRAVAPQRSVAAMGPRRCGGPLCQELISNGKEARWAQANCDKKCRRCFQHKPHEVSEQSGKQSKCDPADANELVPPPPQPVTSDRARPHKACANFPICKRFSQAVMPGAKHHANPTVSTQTLPAAPWLCRTCQSATPCSFPHCESKCAPLFGKGIAPRFCATHYADKSTNVDREWARCSNADQGCQQLALIRSAGKCHACSQGFVPCRHATLGCSAFARASGSCDHPEIRYPIFVFGSMRPRS